jgi:hypothetical protein
MFAAIKFSIFDLTASYLNPKHSNKQGHDFTCFWYECEDWYLNLTDTFRVFKNEMRIRVFRCKKAKVTAGSTDG